MIDAIKRHLAENPLQPFTIVSSSEMKYRVASRDHISFSPSGGRMVIFFDDDSSVIVSALHVTAVETEPSIQQLV